MNEMVCRGCRHGRIESSQESIFGVVDRREEWRCGRPHGDIIREDALRRGHCWWRQPIETERLRKGECADG